MAIGQAVTGTANGILLQNHIFKSVMKLYRFAVIEENTVEIKNNYLLTMCSFGV